MSNKEKVFNTKLYAIISFIGIAALLAIICVSTFSARYTAFHPDELAKTYVDTIVQTGDGYNAYKNTLASYGSKYGDFIRKYYINTAVYRDTEYKHGDNTDDFKGYNDESYKGDKTINDDGTLNGQLISSMYPYYEELINTYGWDNYDAVYKNYINKLIEVRKEIFNDDYLTDEIFFTAFEANVSTYGDTLTGTEDVFDENTGVQLSYASTGIYQDKFGKDYKLTVNVGATQKQIDILDYKQSVGTDKLASYGVNIDDISDIQLLTVNVTHNNEILTTVDVVMVKIGWSWYVENTVTDTSSLYNFYK